MRKGALRQVHDGDKICTNCLRKLSTENIEDYNDGTDNTGSMNVDDAAWTDYNHEAKNLNKIKNDKQDNNTNEEFPSSQEQKYKREEVRRKLDIIFELLNIPTIRDM